MNDDQRDIPGLSDAEEELARELARLGPLMREHEAAEADMNQLFARNLRAQLVYGEEHAPDAGFARTLRARLMRERSARPVAKPFQRRLTVWIGSATMALLVSLLVALLLPRGAFVPSITAPYPTQADLVFSFPAPGTVIHRLTPTISLVHPRPGVPYAGRLRLTAPQLPQEPATLHAYRLASPSNVMVAGRRLLGIRSPVRHTTAGSGTWAVAADGGFPSRRPLHSLAVSLATGELIYHDRRNLVLPRATRALARSRAVAVARRWLTRLGWPGTRMPLTDVESVHTLPKVQEIKFGWIGVGATATAAATVWVTPDRSVIEAWLWPPVVQGGAIRARSVFAAWTEVRAGTLPVAVEGVSPAIRTNGVGVVRRTSLVSVLSAEGVGALYLVPTYRFEGKTHIPGASIHTWYSLAPGGQK